jgi:hypothetical protein
MGYNTAKYAPASAFMRIGGGDVADGLLAAVQHHHQRRVHVSFCLLTADKTNTHIIRRRSRSAGFGLMTDFYQNA